MGIYMFIKVVSHIAPFIDGSYLFKSSSERMKSSIKGKTFFVKDVFGAVALFETLWILN